MTELEEPRVIDVLLVEDDEGDVLMTREAFEYYKIQNRLHVVNDGDQALQFLKRAGPYADAPRPGLILLDVNLPRRSGLEVLADLKNDDDLLRIPVIMLTATASPIDRVVGLELGADDYLAKPCELRELLARVRSVLRRAAPAAAPAEGGNLVRFGTKWLDLDVRLLRDD